MKERRTSTLRLVRPGEAPPDPLSEDEVVARLHGCAVELRQATAAWRERAEAFEDAVSQWETYFGAYRDQVAQ